MVLRLKSHGVFQSYEIDVFCLSWVESSSSKKQRFSRSCRVVGYPASVSPNISPLFLWGLGKSLVWSEIFKFLASLAMGSAYSWGSLLLCTMQGKSFCVCLRLHHLLLDSLISHSRTHYIHRRQCDALWPPSPVLLALTGPFKQGWWNVLSVEGFFFQETSLKQPWVCIVKCISEHNV